MRRVAPAGPLNRWRLAVALFCACLPLGRAAAGTFYVDGKRGNDAWNGGSAAAAWKTIQKACGQVGPGDTVIVAEGIYFEHVELRRGGAVDNPITFLAQNEAEGAVTVSGADASVRTGQIGWTLADAPTALYVQPADHEPVRVLYDDVDLFPYRSLQELKDFRLSTGTPGPNHGYCFDRPSGMLYVRLYPGGKYGPVDPNQHVMKVAPVRGAGSAARFVHQPSDYNFGILIPDLPAYVVLEGFTFETPGVAGVYTMTGNLTVRKCWFHGCRWAVTGVGDGLDPARRSNDVTVEYCDWGHVPTFDDALDVVKAVRKMAAEEKRKLPPFYWWERKQDVPDTYETGMVGRVGDRWIVRHNFIHDTVDGISSWGSDTSRGCDIYGNCFYQLIDNAVEAENHNQAMRIHDNYILDVFEPFSWQPLDGLPWPGPMWIYRNVVEDTAKGDSYFDQLDWERGCFKILAEKSNWQAAGMEKVDSKYVEIPPPGLVAYNNTVNMQGVLFTLGTAQRTLDNVRLINNVLVARLMVSSSATEFNVSKFTFAGNAVRFTEEKDPSATAVCAGVGGTPLGDEVRAAAADAGHTGISKLANVTCNGVSQDLGAPDLVRQAGALPEPDRYIPPLVGPGAQRKPILNDAGS